MFRSMGKRTVMKTNSRRRSTREYSSVVNEYGGNTARTHSQGRPKAQSRMKGGSINFGVDLPLVLGDS